jgi:hypothetical protein
LLDVMSVPNPTFPLVCGVLAAIGIAGCAAMGADIVDTTPRSPTEPPVPVGQDVMAAGQQLDVRLQRSLSSTTAEVDDEFEATTVADLHGTGGVLVPAGSVVRGRVAGVDDAGQFDRTTSLLLEFDRILVRGRSHELRAHAVEAFPDVPGVLIGGGLVSGTDGVHVELPAGTLLRIQIDRAVDLS